MDHSEDSGTICAGTEEPTISNRSMHRRVKQREGRAKRRAARREKRVDAREEVGSGVNLPNGGVAAVMSHIANSSPTVQQSPVSNSKNARAKNRICRGDDNNQISQRNHQKLKILKEQTTMHHQGTGSTAASALRHRPGPAQRNMQFFRKLFESDTRPSDWSLACDMRVQYEEFPDTDQSLPFGRISAIVWEIEYMAADVIDRPLSGFKEVKRLYAEKTEQIAFYKKKLAKAKSINNRVARNYFHTRRGDEESAKDYKSLKYAELLLAHLIPILEVEQTKLSDLMGATGKAYSQLKACTRLYKQQLKVRESVEQLKQRQLEVVRKQTQEEAEGGQLRTDHWILEWKGDQYVLEEKEKSLMSDNDFFGLKERHDIGRQAYELLLRDRRTKANLYCGQAIYSTYRYSDLPDSGF